MYIGRNKDGSIYGLWTVKQWDGQEEKPDDDSEIVEFLKAQEARLEAMRKGA